MQWSAESTAICFPITAIHCITFKGVELVLAGQGPFLCVYDGSSLKTIHSTRIFNTQAIHSIISSIEGSCLRLLIIGGRLTAQCDLRIAQDERDAPNTNAVLELINTHEAEDWILKSCAYRSTPTEWFAVTANNSLLHVSSDEGSSIARLTNGPRSFLYCGDLQSLDNDSVLVVGGSVFGEILVWVAEREQKASAWAYKLLHTFYGHIGSVFGVTILPIINLDSGQLRVLASCSDDRTIRLWKMADPTDLAKPSNINTTTTNTGFGNAIADDAYQLGMTWGHLSRIWGIAFLSLVKQGEDEVVQLMTRGEDATCQQWAISMNPQTTSTPNRIEHIASVKHHSGKHIWAFASATIKNRNSIFTGGADGQIVQQVSVNTEHNHNTYLLFRQTFTTIQANLKQYLVVDNNTVLAATTTGNILIFRRSNSSGYEWLPMPKSIVSARLCSNSLGGIALIKHDEGLDIFHASTGDYWTIPFTPKANISWFQVADQSGIFPRDSFDMHVLVAFAAVQSAICIHASFLDRELCSKEYHLALPEKFAITASCYDRNNDLLFLGARSGAIAIYNEMHREVTSIAGVVLKSVHGSDAVTSISLLPSRRGHVEPISGLHILTTGRDGTYAIHLITFSENGATSLDTVHRAIPPFGPNIEGANLVTQDDGHTYNIVLHGFRSKEFVVWNETQHQSVSSVDCGGAHRSWNYGHNVKMIGSGGTFVWTQAGNFSYFNVPYTNNDTVQNGGHGREIKASAKHPLPYTTESELGYDGFLVATGAEDTTIRLFVIESPSRGNLSMFRPLSVLEGHTAGIQDLAFSPCGSYLISCAGSEELFVWKIAFGVPLVEIGVVLQTKMVRHVDDFDARILGLDIRTRQGDSEFMNLEIVTAYSNGKAKILRYLPNAPNGSNQFTTIDVIVFGTFCLNRALYCGSDDNSILTAGTNGYLHVTMQGDPSEEAASPLAVSSHRVHQSSIMAMASIDIYPGLVLACTGGDDNAFGVTLIAGRAYENLRFHTILVPRAHAAALTAVTIVGHRKTNGQSIITLVTAGNDQRVVLWEIVVITDECNEIDDMLGNITLTKLSTTWTGVADVSSSITLKTSHHNHAVDVVEVMVVGVGMEILQFHLHNDKKYSETI